MTHLRRASPCDLAGAAPSKVKHAAIFPAPDDGDDGEADDGDRLEHFTP